jgi:hypothetical protein
VRHWERERREVVVVIYVSFMKLMDRTRLFTIYLWSLITSYLEEFDDLEVDII